LVNAGVSEERGIKNENCFEKMVKLFYPPKKKLAQILI